MTQRISIQIVEDYEEAAMRTAKQYPEGFTFSETEMNLIHAALGIAGEAGEFCTAIKEALIYLKKPDRENMKEELGDLMWYINLAARSIEYQMISIMKANIEKLAKRYPEKYTDEAAIARADKSEIIGTKGDVVWMDELAAQAPVVPYPPINYDIKIEKQEQTASQHNNLQRIMNEAGDVLYFVSPKQMDAMNYKYCYGPFSGVELAEVFIKNKPERILTTITRGTINWSDWFLKAGWVPA